MALLQAVALIFIYPLSVHHYLTRSEVCELMQRARPFKTASSAGKVALSYKDIPIYKKDTVMR